jgi:ribosome-interacting GTPase 1
MVLCHDSTRPVSELDALRDDLAAAGIALPAIIAATKSDEASPNALVEAAHGLTVVPVSILDNATLDALRDAIWTLTGLLRVYLRQGDDITAEPLALPPPVTVLDVAHAIHHALGDRCQGARLWGASAKFSGQLVGRHHVLVDSDTVEIVSATRS